MINKVNPSRVYTFGEDLSGEEWTPKNIFQMQALYEPHMKEACEKIGNLPTEVHKFVQGTGYNDRPPYKGVVINIFDATPKDIIKLIKDTVENNYVTIDLRSKAYLQ